MRPDVTRRIACAVGCEVTSEGAENGEPRVKFECPSGWAAARFLLEAARADVNEPDVRALAARLRRAGGAFAEAVHAFVASEIRFEKEEGEVFQSPMVTLARGAGDCDCQARLVYALLSIGGVPARLAFLHRGGNPLHVLAQAWDRGRWRWLETTVRGARYDEHPLSAARRVGQIRSDVGGAMKEAFMGNERVTVGSVYVVQVGLLKAEPKIGETLEAAGFYAGREVGALGIEAPPHLREPVPNARQTKWIRAVAMRAGEIELPAFGDGVVIQDVWRVA